MIQAEKKIAPLVILDEPGKTELKSKFIELRAKGYSYAKIARKLKVSKSTVANWSQELEAEIASLKAIELESLYERYYLTKESRIKLLGDQLKEIRSELKKRELDEVSTDKLIELELKIYQALMDEYVDIRPLSDQEILELKQ
jgi:transposase